MRSLGEPVAIFQSFPFKHEVGLLALGHSVVSDSETLRTETLPGSSVHGTSQVTILKWVAIPFSRGSSWPMDRTWVSCLAGRFYIFWATRVESFPKKIIWLVWRLSVSFFACSPTNIEKWLGHFCEGYYFFMPFQNKKWFLACADKDSQLLEWSKVFSL